jgi:hypothetical protein
MAQPTVSFGRWPRRLNQGEFPGDVRYAHDAHVSAVGRLGAPSVFPEHATMKQMESHGEPHGFPAMTARVGWGTPTRKSGK